MYSSSINKPELSWNYKDAIEKLTKQGNKKNSIYYSFFIISGEPYTELLNLMMFLFISSVHKCYKTILWN